MRKNLHAVRVYPGGGMIYRKTSRYELLHPLLAMRELEAGRYADVWLEELRVLRSLLRVRGLVKVGMPEVQP